LQIYDSEEVGNDASTSTRMVVLTPDAVATMSSMGFNVHGVSSPHALPATASLSRMDCTFEPCSLLGVQNTLFESIAPV
jgi:hypothetical protein